MIYASREVSEIGMAAEIDSPIIEVDRLTGGPSIAGETRRSRGRKSPRHNGFRQSSTVELIHSVAVRDRERVRRWLEQLQTTTGEVSVEFETNTIFGTHYFEARGAVSGFRGGLPAVATGGLRELAASEFAQRRQELSDDQVVLLGDITTAIAQHEPLIAVLDMVREALERWNPGAWVCILAVDRTRNRLRFMTGTTTPESYRVMIESEVIEAARAPSTCAVLRGEFSVFGLTSNEQFADWVGPLMSEFGRSTSWVMPLKASAGEVLGTISVVLGQAREPEPLEVEWLTRLSLLAQLAFELEAAAGSLTGYVRHDPMTGMLNHTSIVERVEARLDRGENRFSLLLVSLDRFRLFSDRIGHVNADRVLIAAAERIAATVGGNGRVGHLERGEFAVLVDHRADAHDTAERLLQAFDQPLEYDSGELLLVPKIGIVDAEGREDAHALFVDGIAAMQEAGAAGGGNVSHFQQGQHTRVLDRIKLGSELRHALDSDQLEVHYQPIVDLRSGGCAHLEALVRWRHPRRGLLAPDEFIGLAEESGLIVSIGTAVLRQSMAQVSRWRERWPDLRVSVNVSPRQLALPEFPTLVGELLAAHRLDARAIMLELTESNLMGGLEVFESQLEQLRAAGLSVLIDDFGTGLSSLSRLYELPIAAVKIDRSFIARLCTDATAQAVVRAITQIAVSHGCLVVAEGIEDEATATLAREANCDFGQGFQFGRPMAAGHLEHWLAARR